MYDKEARREKYLRHKNCEKKHSCIEEKEAYEKIKWKWGFDDLQIKRLLQDYTVKEIFFGSYENGIFTPKNLFKLFGLIILMGVIWTGYHLETKHEGVMSYKGNPCEVVDNMFNDIFHK